MPFSKFKVLTFDVVGTLIDFEKGILDSIRRLGGPSAQTLTDDQIFEPYLRGRAAHPGRSSEVMFHVYLALARELDLPQDKITADAFQLDVLRWPSYPDTNEALMRLRKRFRLIALTNADRVALSCYAHTMGDPFDDSISSDDTGVAKPDPQFFAYNRGRQSAHGCKLSDILHVAQSQYHDIGIARALGYSVCWIERRQGMNGYGGTPVPEQVTKPDFHFSSLKALADAVDASYKALQP